MILGFTGTSEGMTSEQVEGVRTFLRKHRLKIKKAGHGDCVGSDKQFDGLLWAQIPSEIFPPDNDSKRAFCDAPVIHPPKPYLDRDWDIAEFCTDLLATPKEFVERRRGSGTWATIRYARRLGKTVHIIFPDGSLVVEKGYSAKTARR